jgi:hypothetical protein
MGQRAPPRFLAQSSSSTVRIDALPCDPDDAIVAGPGEGEVNAGFVELDCHAVECLGKGAGRSGPSIPFKMIGRCAFKTISRSSVNCPRAASSDFTSGSAALNVGAHLSERARV